MSIKYYDSINLQQNQLINAVLHTMSTAPASPVEGQAWYDTTNNVLKIYNGTSWDSVSHEITVDQGSSAFVSITNGVLSFHNLAITTVTVDNTYTDLASFVAAQYVLGNEFQEGDMIILTAATNQQMRSFIHNGGVAGTEADFTRLQTDIDTSTIRAALSGNSGVTYDSVNGVFSADVDDATVQVGASGIELKDGGVSTAKLADDSVTKAKIAADVAGIGLNQNVDGSLEVSIDGTSLKVVEGAITVDPDVVGASLAGTGLTYDATANTLNVDSNDTLFTVGDGTTTTHTVTHNFGTKLFKAELIKESTGETVMCNFVRTSTTVQFYVNPALATNDGKLILTKYNV